MTEGQGVPETSAEGEGGGNARIVKALLCIAPPTTSKETKIFLQHLRNFTIPDIYNRILRLNKLSNKELLHFITVMNAHPFYRSEPSGLAILAYGGLDLEALVNLKFPAQDKYLSQVAIEYFGIVEKVYSRLTERQRLEIFVRYLYLFENNICNDVALYCRFAFVLRNGFLDTFLMRQFYLGFSFTKEFLVDFRGIGNSSVKIGYEMPHLRELVLSLALDGCVQRASWLARHWRVPSPFTVADMFYLFDCIYFIEDRAVKHLSMEVDILECLAKDFEAHGYSLVPEKIGSKDMHGMARLLAAVRPVCSNEKHVGPHQHSRDVAAWASQAVAAKRAFSSAVQAFNESMELKSISVEHLRISPRTNLRVLGEFLCKPKNLGLLEGFACSFEFQKLDILESLRVFLSSFYMVGESQIIERIVRVFVTVYLRQNDLCQDAQAGEFDKYKSLVYSFVVLNTMLHNPSVEKRPSFDEYCRLVGFSEGFVINNETLRSYYISIKEREIKLPISWEDSYDKYLLSLELSARPAPCAGAPGAEPALPAPILDISPEETADPRSTDSPSSPFGLCAGCILYSYQVLFASSYKAFFSMNPRSFERVCRLLGSAEVYEEYIVMSKHNINKALEAFKYYLLRYPMKPELAAEFLNLLGQTAKPKASVFSDIKSLFGASKPDLHDAESPAELASYVLHPYANIIKDLSCAKFTCQGVCNSNLKLLYKAAMHSRTADAATLLRGMVTSLLLSNAQMVNDISYLSGPLLAKVVQRNPSLIDLFSDDQKLTYLLSKKELDSHDWDAFRRISSNGPVAFGIFCRAQGKFGSIGDAFQVYAREQAPSSVPASGVEARVFGDFVIVERYAEALKDSNNVVKLFSTSNSALNLKIAKGLQKDECPLENPLFLNFNAIVYMLEKSSRGSSVLQGYALRIVGHLSGSLILLVRMFVYVYSVLPSLDPSLRHSLLQVLLRRLQSAHRGEGACCALHPSADMSEANFLVKSLLSDSYVREEDVIFMGPQSKPSIVEL